jgi:hypothetical protein
VSYKLVFAPEIEVDLGDAYIWYEDRRPGLGEEFLSCVDACIQAIYRMPELHVKNLQRLSKSIGEKISILGFLRL